MKNTAYLFDDQTTEAVAYKRLLDGAVRAGIC